MKIGIIGNGFVGRATQIFSNNYFTQDPYDNNNECFEILPDTACTPAKPNSVMTYSGTIVEASDSSVDTAVFGRTPPFFKHIYFKPIQVYIYDIRPEACQPLGITLEEVDRECDILFFCLPTPLHHDGSCYTQILEDTLARCSNPYKVIRSTIPVGFAADHRCYFMPEFLTEANWEDDFRSTKEWIIGIPPALTPAEKSINVEFKARIQTLIKRSHKNRSIDSQVVVFCDTNEAEMLKLMKNCFLSAKVGLMNEFYDFCRATNTDYNTVTRLAKQDARMGTSHFQVPGPDGRRGFGGTCFPKDTHSLYCQMNAHGVAPQIYPAILTRNDTHDRPEREWSRDVWRTTIPLPTPTSKVVVVFSDTRATTVSEYLRDIIRTNLAKNNVVIQVVRGSGKGDDVHQEREFRRNKNFLVKHRTDPSAPLFFPRVDECYYTQHTGDRLYDIMRDVSCVIDLWNSHEEMALYVIKKHDIELSDESGSEGFESDCDKVIENQMSIPILEDYYHSKYDSKESKRRLIILF
jgi:UDPglucose 6-dehydrogenase